MFKWLKVWGEEVKQKFYPVVPGYFGGAWLASDFLTNPREGDILVLTGPLSAGIYKVCFRTTTRTTLSTHNITYQHRDKSNSVSITEHSVGVHNAQSPFCYEVCVKVRQSESFRIVAQIDITAIVQASINYMRIYPLVKGQ